MKFSVPPGGAVAGKGVVIEVGRNLLKSYTLDIDRGKLDMHVWVRMRWKDERLRWNATEWAGVNSVNHNKYSDQQNSV